MKLRLIFLAVIIGAYLLKYPLFDMSAVPETDSFKIDLNGAREKAGSDNLPVAMGSIVIGEHKFPSKAVVAGDSFFDKTPLLFVSYQAQYQDGSYITIDTAHDKSIQDEFFSGSPFYLDKYEQMQASLLKSKMIIVTHEHMDHLGGIAQASFLSRLAPKIKLTSEQIKSPKIADARFPEGSLEKLTPIEYDDYYKLAPGIVLIKAPGHSPGSQIIYVKRADGHEYLFIGDIAWNFANIRRLTGRPWFVSTLFLNEDREQVAAQLRELWRLSRQEKISIVVSHDPEQYKVMRAQGLLTGNYL